MRLSYSPAARAGASSGRRMGVSALALTAAITAAAFAGAAHAQDDSPASAGDLNTAVSAQPLQLAQNTASTAPPEAAAPANPVAGIAPPGDYTVDAVDKKIGTNPFARFVNYYFAEWGKATAPVDPKAPSSLRDGWPAPPQSTPPMPFTDWPYGGTTLIGDNRTASVDSPLMVALAHTPVGDFVSKTGIQLYGWVDFGGNISTSKNKGGNAPAAYDYNPNNIQLDQAVLYLERTPDTVQTDHIDWGFRASAIYGENYRYTTAYGIASYQFLQHNHFYGYDFPMMYGEVYIPKVMEGLMIRVGRFISLPDIEAQLAPNNYMYTHSITYTLDNYTNEGIQTTLAVTKQIMLQVGLTTGTEAAVWNMGVKSPNLFLQQGLGPDPLYPEKTYFKDPGAQPTWTFCGRWQSKNGNTSVNACADAINRGQWGYNNLQWYGLTAYHKFNQYFHVSWEFYNEHQDGVPNGLNPTVQNIVQNGGTPFSPQWIPYNAPNLAQCKNAQALRCRSDSYGTVAYWNFSPNPLNNFSLRTEYYDDPQGQRTGVATSYYEVGIGLQHWLSPQIELRPEFTSYWSAKPSFDAGTKRYARIFSGDIIWHF